MEKFIVGKVLKPRGLKGELKVQILTDFPERFKDRDAYWVGLTTDTKTHLHVEFAQLHQGIVLIKFKGIDSLEDAELLREQFLFVDESDLTVPDKDYYYDHQLIGFKVINTNDVQCGILKAVIHMPANDVYNVDYEGRSVLIPATYEFVVKIDVENQVIYVDRFDEFLS